MKKLFVSLIVLAMLFTTGCSTKDESKELLNDIKSYVKFEHGTEEFELIAVNKDDNKVIYKAVDNPNGLVYCEVSLSYIQSVAKRVS